MKFVTLVATLSLLPIFGLCDTLSYDQTYDNAATSLSVVACSNGPNGLLTAGFTDFGSIPGFPNIGGAQAVEGFDSVNCGSCWQLTYVNPKGVSSSIEITAVDHTLSGFNIALAAMNKLTDNQAVFLGRVNVTSKMISTTPCAQ